MRGARILLALIALGDPGGVSSSAAADDYEWRLPAGFPPPAVPEENPMSSAKVELGRHLFFDERLSGNGTFACASCHRAELAFTDGRAQAVGSTGELHRRSSMSLVNVAYNVTYNWANPDVESLEEQMLVPMFGQHPIELGLEGHLEETLEMFEADPATAARFRRAFPESPHPIALESIVQAIASFERTLVSGNSPYDRYVFWGESEALSAAARRGMELFFSERLACGECHAGFNLSGPTRHALGPGTPADFHNTGLFDVDGRGGFPDADRGALEVTGEADDMGRFRAPTLRNVALTAPYMHDGSIDDLEAVLDHYAAGGRSETERDPRSTPNPLKSPLLRGFDLTELERDDLLAFLESLTDESFLQDPRFSDPSR